MDLWIGCLSWDGFESYETYEIGVSESEIYFYWDQ
jgi:hypothetical protein